MPMNHPSREQQRQYLNRWGTLGPAMDAIRHDEIRRMTNEGYLRAMEQLWSVEVDPAPRDSSGLVEWQRLMRR
jgi:hypothetical protein